MTERLRIPRVATAREAGLVVRVDRVGVDADGAFVMVQGARRDLPPELRTWAAIAGALGVAGLVEFGRHAGMELTRDRGYYARVLDEDAPVPARGVPRRGVP